MKKQTIKFIIFLLTGICAILFCAQICVNVFLVNYIESFLVKEIAVKYGIKNAEIDILGIGIRGTSIGPVTLGDEENLFLSVSSIKVKYSLASLIKKHIKSSRVF